MGTPGHKRLISLRADFPSVLGTVMQLQTVQFGLKDEITKKLVAQQLAGFAKFIERVKA
jgi:hypothetical protein